MKPYYQDKSGIIYHGDARSYIHEYFIPEVHPHAFLFTDPPYNVGKKYGNWNDSLPDDEYLEFCRQWISVVKVISEFQCIYPPTKYLPEYWRLLGKDFRQIVMTVNAAGAIRYGFSNQFSSLLTNASPSKPVMNWWNNISHPAMGFYFREENYDHPGYTSEAITSKVIGDLSGDAEWIIDPFCGTGTTLRCAKDRGKKFIGIDNDERCCELSALRVSQGVLGLQ